LHAVVGLASLAERIVGQRLWRRRDVSRVLKDDARVLSACAGTGSADGIIRRRHCAAPRRWRHWRITGWRRAGGRARVCRWRDTRIGWRRVRGGHRGAGRCAGTGRSGAVGTRGAGARRRCRVGRCLCTRICGRVSRLGRAPRLLRKYWHRSCQRGGKDKGLHLDSPFGERRLAARGGETPEQRI